MNFRLFPHEISARRRHAVIIQTRNIATRRGKTARGWLATSIGVNIRGEEGEGSEGSYKLHSQFSWGSAGWPGCELQSRFYRVKAETKKEARKAEEEETTRRRERQVEEWTIKSQHLQLHRSNRVWWCWFKFEEGRRVDFESFSNFTKGN